MNYVYISALVMSIVALICNVYIALSDNRIPLSLKAACCVVFMVTMILILYAMDLCIKSIRRDKTEKLKELFEKVHL